MRRFTILLSFVPWVIFYVLDKNNIFSTTISALVSIIILVTLDYQRLKKLFLLPSIILLMFTTIAINSYLNLLPWITHNYLLLMNILLAGIIWLLLIFKKPFTIEYAKEMVGNPYWYSPLFKKINWTLSILWAITITALTAPNLLMKTNHLAFSTISIMTFDMTCLVIVIYLTAKLPDIIIGHNFWSTISKLPKVNSRFLEYGYKPIHKELNLKNLTVIGEIPQNLEGIYLRNGPNPYFTPHTYTHPFDGDGLIHRISIENGKVSYKSRFVKTKALNAEIIAGKSLYGGIKLPITPDPKFIKSGPIKNTASINVLRINNDHILALSESAPAYVLNNKLETLHEWRPNNKKSFLVNGHYRKDYTTNQMYMFTYEIDNPDSFLRLYEFNAEYKLINDIKIPKCLATMIHDFVITPTYIIFFDNPAIFNFVNNTGTEPFFAFDDQLETDIYLINRKDFSIKTIKNLDNFFIYHFVNAFEYKENQDDYIIIDFIYNEELEFNPKTNNKTQPLLYRGKINLNNMTYQHQPLSAQAVDLPSYNLKYTGQKYTYAYLLTRDSSALSGFNAILKYNLDTLEQKIISFGNEIELDEAIFVEKSDNLMNKNTGLNFTENNSNEEDNGYLMMFAYNKNTDTSNFIILEANNNNQILATIKLPVRVPHGLHGSWSNQNY